jgi:hypothetical protein
VHWIVVRDGRVTNRRLAGGAGMGLDYALGGGPDIALSHWDAHGELDGWWSDAVCDGGALIDADARRLLFFTVQPWTVWPGEAFAYRAAMLDAYARVWAGWQVEWAYDGIADLARYIGADPAAVRVPITARLTDADLRTENPIALLSIGTYTYGLVTADGPPWWLGLGVLNQLTNDRRISASPMPQMGLHLDTTTRRAGLWSVRPLCGILQGWPLVWPGWQLEFWGDRYAEQLSRSGFTLVPPEPARALNDLAERVEAYLPGDAGLRAMQAEMAAGRRSRAALTAMEAARDAAAPAAAALAALIRNR